MLAKVGRWCELCLLAGPDLPQEVLSSCCMLIRPESLTSHLTSKTLQDSKPGAFQASDLRDYEHLYRNPNPRDQTLQIGRTSDRVLSPYMQMPRFSPSLTQRPTPGLSIEHPTGKAAVCPWPAPGPWEPCPGLCQMRCMALLVLCWEGSDALCVCRGVPWAQ